MSKFAILLVLLLGTVLPRPLQAALIGDPAEPLTIKEWLKGQPVQIKPGTNIFVIEIWNTTGPACRAATTNLNDIQVRYGSKGVVVVGVSDEPAETITNFLQHEGSNIQYTVAADQHRATSMAYMEPAAQIGVPYAFIVGTNGNLLWTGHPLRGLETALSQILAGTYNLQHAQDLELAHRQMEQYIALSRRGDARTRAAGTVLLAARTNNLDLLLDMAYELCADPQLRNHDFPLAAKALLEAEKLAPTNSPRVMIYKAVYLFHKGRHKGGLMLGQRALDAAQTPADKINIQSMLDSMKAWMVVYEAQQHSRTNQTTNAQSALPAAGASTMTNKGAAVSPKP
jgi:hypothetical protein